MSLWHNRKHYQKSRAPEARNLAIGPTVVVVRASSLGVSSLLLDVPCSYDKKNLISTILLILMTT